MSDDKTEMERLIVENRRLKKIVKNTLWMAKNYAEVDKLFLPYTVNNAIDSAKSCGLKLEFGYAKDKFLGRWNSRRGKFIHQE